MLLRNGTIRNDQPGRFLGALHHLDLPLWTQHRRNMFVGGVDAKSSVPVGNMAPSAIVLAQKAGGISSRQLKAISLTATATGGLGMPGEGATTISITTNNPSGELVTTVPPGGAPASFAITTNNPLLTASINGTASAEFAITTNAPILGAIAGLTASTTVSITTNNPTIYPLDDTSPLRTATASFEFSGTLDRYAVGIMEGTTNVSDVVTNASVANAVWQSLVAEYAESGTMGNALATASSGGVDPSILAAAILAAAQVSPIHADIQKVNSYDVTGNGQTGTEWGPA